MGDKIDRVESVILTEESLMALLQGKDIHLNMLHKGEHIQFRFRGPWDGVWLTHGQVSELEYNAQMRTFSMIDKLQKVHIQDNTNKIKKG